MMATVRIVLIVRQPILSDAKFSGLPITIPPRMLDYRRIIIIFQSSI